MVLVMTILYAFEKARQALFEGLNDIEQNGQRRHRAVILDLRDKPLADPGLPGKLFQRDVLLRSFRLDLVADQQKELFIHFTGGQPFFVRLAFNAAARYRKNCGALVAANSP
jgi:hypothetical protein